MMIPSDLRIPYIEWYIIAGELEIHHDGRSQTYEV